MGSLLDLGWCAKRFAMGSLLLLLAAAGNTPAMAQTYLPSVKIGTAALIAPSAANSSYSTDTTSTNTIPVSGRPPEIVALARALKNDPDLIYQYVRNNIETVWEYGLQKGALGASIDRSGTAFDQAMLMVELLRQAGYTATYEVGRITLTGAQFQAWTNITSAAAACQLLSSGGIPAQVNGTSSVTNCAGTFGNAAVSTVEMAHVWVKVAIAGDLTCGSACLFDPAYKPYTWVAGINLDSAMGFTAGAPLTAATGTMDSGSSSGLSYVHNLNAGGLYSLIQGYATGLLTYLRGNAMSGAQIEDVVGGGVIQPATATALRQATLPYTAAVDREWTGGVPNPYRCTLLVHGEMRNIFTSSIETLFDHTFYVDEIYGRRLGIGTNFNAAQSGYNAYNSFVSNLTLDDQVIDTAHTMAGVYPNGHYPVSLTIAAKHPYAASADGTVGTAGDYMDTTIYKSAILVNPVTIVSGWGDVSPELLAKWSGERAEDTPAPGHLDPPPCSIEPCDPPSPYLPSTRDFTNQKLAAGFLAQYTRAARLHAAIAGGMVQTHHVVGVVYSDDYIEDDNSGRIDGSQPDYWSADSYTRIDVDTGLSFVSKSADAAKRRAAILSIAATSAALEGSIVSQTSDVPDVSSTATRFEWGNAPPSAEDPSAAGPRRFFNVDATVSVPSSGWVLWENTTVPVHSLATVDGDPASWASDEMTALRNDINAYTAGGYTVTAAQESFLGPGQRGGFVKVLTDPHTHIHTYVPAYTKQRGGAFIATKYVNGEPVAIAHDVVGVIAPDSYGVVRPAKGGGGGVQPNIAATYSPPAPADVLKARFVDRSNMLGVNLDNGSMTAKSPAMIELGTGGAPYSLGASFTWHPGALPSPTFGPVVPGGPVGWVHNWYNNLALSGSGMDGMGVSDVRAAAGAIAAFRAEQDIFSATVTPQRDVAASLSQAWLTKQFSGNSITATVGDTSRQFVRLADNSWIAPGASYGFVTVTGTRAPFEMRCSIDQAGPHYALSRGWDNSGLSFTVTDGQGSRQNFGYWLQHATASTGPGSFCDRVTGFRLNSWNFPSGVTISLAYAADTGVKDGATRSTSPNADNFYPSSTTLLNVSNSLGRTLTFGTNVSTGQPTVSDGNRTLTGPAIGGTTTTDPAGIVTTFHYASFTASATQRPIPFAALDRIYTADHPSSPNVQYDYDGTGMVMQVEDANNLQIGGYSLASTGGRDPWKFYIAPGWRGERDDPLYGHDTTENGTDKGYVVIRDTKAVGASYRRQLHFIDELGRETVELLDGRGRAVSYIYPELDQENLTYDERNNPLSLTKLPKPGSADATAGRSIAVSLAYSEGTTVWTCSNIFTCNKPLTQTDALSNVTNLSWDATTGMLTAVIKPAAYVGAAREETDYGYSSFGGAGFKLLTTITQNTGPSGGATGTTVTTYAYNSANFYVPQSATADSGSGKLNLTTNYTFDAIGNPTDVDGPRSDVADVTDFTWDLDRHQVFGIQADPDGAGPHPRPAVRTTYDAVGRPSVVETGTVTSAAGAGWSGSGDAVTTTYDPAGNKVLESTATRRTQYSYDGVNRVLCTALRMNRNADGSFGTLPADACALSTATTYGPDRIVKVIYDRAGQARQELRAFGTAIQETYATYKFSPNGKPIAIADADAAIAVGVNYADALNANTPAPHQTNYAYGGFDELLVTTFGDNTNEQLVYFSGTTPCSSDIQPCSRANRSNQTFTFLYDKLNRITSKAVPAAEVATAHTVTTIYDLQDRTTNVNDSVASSTIALTFDAIGRKLSETRTTPGLTAKTVTYSYDNGAGDKVDRYRLTWPDGYYANYAYDALGHVTTVVDSGGTTLATYLYDDLARRAQVQYNGTTGAKMLYSWSAEGDLLTLTSDFAGTANDVSFTHQFTPAHQWANSAISNTAFRYTPPSASNIPYTNNAVNEIGTFNAIALGYDSRGNYLGQQAFPVYSFDAENRMVKAVSYTYSYDPLGRRTQKVIGAVTTNFVHDGDMEIAEYDGTGALLRRFVPGPVIDDHVAMVTAAGVKTFFHVDKMGSVIAMSDTSGNLAEGPYLYDGYGACTSGGGTCTGGVPFRYTGQRFDSETSFYYYRARLYAPLFGRFIQTDPIGYKDDLNLYAYVGNDPANGVDPSGLCVASHIGTAAGSVCQQSDKDPTLRGSSANKKAVARPSSQSPENGGFVAAAWPSNGPPVSIWEEIFERAPELGPLGVFIYMSHLGDPTPEESAVYFALSPHFPSQPSQLGHIFRNAPGHFSRDTAANRGAIMSAVRGDTYSHIDRNGNVVFGRINPNGTQIWVQVRDGVIQNAGINPTPQNLRTKLP